MGQKRKGERKMEGTRGKWREGKEGKREGKKREKKRGRVLVRKGCKRGILPLLTDMPKGWTEGLHYNFYLLMFFP